MKSESMGDSSRARTDSQRAAYAETVDKGICPFCGPTDQLPKEIRPKMIFEGNFWRAWFNPDPYPGHATHIILAPIEHWTQPSDVTLAAAAEWWELNAWLIEKLNLPGGGIVMRFGGHEYKGGSITHLHSHIQVPDMTAFSIAVFYADAKLQKFFSESNKDT
jgi:diadenosine tetraphosphate (Ap4A) HIT family hydrolase